MLVELQYQKWPDGGSIVLRAWKVEKAKQMKDELVSAFAWMQTLFMVFQGNFKNFMQFCAANIVYLKSSDLAVCV